MRLKSVSVVLLLTCLLSAFAADPAKENADLATARVKFEQEIAAAIKPVEKRYLARLETLQKELTRKKDIDGAYRAKVAIDELKANPVSSQLGATLEGTWSVKYSNGNTRSYVVSADGGVRFLEDKMTGKVTWDKDAWVFDFGDGKFERGTVQRMLHIEHYTSNVEFDERKPSITGNGIRKN